MESHRIHKTNFSVILPTYGGPPIRKALEFLN